MALPKKKVSKARSSKRFHANSHATAPTLVECNHCHEKKLAHVVCKECGYYDGKQVLEIKSKEAEEGEK